jgi:hypothetical protein
MAGRERKKRISRSEDAYTKRQKADLTEIGQL